MRPLLLLLVLAVAPAAALEPEIDRRVDMAYACWPIYKDPPVQVPTVTDKRTGKTDEKLTRVLRWTPLKAARALRKLELHRSHAACPPYAGGRDVKEMLDELVAVATAAARAGVDEFASRNLSFDVSWGEMPLSALEASQGETEPAPGDFAGVCRPPAVSEELFVPAAGQASTEEEKKAFAELEARARALRVSLRETRADVAELLEALEGRSCEALGRRYHAVAGRQRWAYLQHRDDALGKLLRERLKWEPLADAKP